MKLIILTYENGYQVGYFKNDPELLETILADFDSIDEMHQVNYDGRVYTPERALRELIRQQGKAMARKTFEKMVGEADAQRLYFPKQEK
tara:strand:+ start:247 stop:513 length:267 start_codon:yes stop_codon:yes gene_type:complete